MTTMTKSTKKRAFQARSIGPSTINNPTENDYICVRTAVKNNLLKYVTFNLEIGENGTPHLQISAIASTPLTAKAWQNALGQRVGNIVATASPPDCKDYCQGFKVNTDRTQRKDGSQDINTVSETGHNGYEEYGSYSTTGQRTDLTKAIDNIKSGMSIRDLIEIMPGTVNGAYRMLTEYKTQTILLTAKQQVLERYDNVQWKPFQQDILDHLSTKADGRTLHWYHEPTGNIGKSYLTKYLMCTDQAYCPDITKPADIFCGYNMEPVVIFDIPRSRIDTMDHIYGVIEKFLNGMIFVGKYASHTMCINPPHVIVFSNDLPKTHTDKGNLTLSEDRWNIVQLKADGTTILMNQARHNAKHPAVTPPEPTKKRKEPDFVKSIMDTKDANPQSTKQTRLDTAPPYLPVYKTVEGMSNPTLFNKNDE